MRFISYLLPFIAAASAVSAAAAPLEERAEPCPYAPERMGGSSVPIAIQDLQSDRQWTVYIKFWGSGQSGCVYDVVRAEGSTEVPFPAVAKTARNDVQTDHPQNEMDALTAVGELYIHGHDRLGREWIVMKKQPGNVITETPAWQDMFPDGCNLDYSPQAIKNCDGFMRRIYGLLADRAVAYAQEAHVDHGGHKFAKFLFTNDLGEVNFINWRDAVQMYPTRGALASLRDRYMNLAVTSDLPIEDGDDVQGICDSVRRRMEGAEWKSPWDSDYSDLDDSD